MLLTSAAISKGAAAFEGSLCVSAISENNHVPIATNAHEPTMISPIFFCSVRRSFGRWCSYLAFESHANGVPVQFHRSPRSRSLDQPKKQEPPVLDGGSAGRAFKGYQLGGFPPKGAPLTGCENNGPKNLTAARGMETVLARVAVLRLPSAGNRFSFFYRSRR
jgi:hypothetical protein